jgi:hypothetical protein
VTNCVGNHQPSDSPDWKWPTASSGLLCQRCRSRLSSLLIQLPSLAAWLEENIAATSNPNGPKISGSREDPMPLRPDILDLVGPTSSREISVTLDPNAVEQYGEPSLLDVIGSWCLLVSEERNDDWPPRNDLTTLCRWLHSQLDWIVAQLWVDDLLSNLQDTARKAERLAPRDPEHRWLKPPCPSCNRKALVFTRGIGIACQAKIGGCGRTWEDDEYDRLIIVLGYEAMEATA